MPNSFLICLLLIAILTQGLAARGQQPVFGIYSAAGTIKYSPARKGAGGPRPIAQHDWLYNGDKLQLLDNMAETILFDRDSGYVRLMGRGAYTTADIDKMRRTHVRDTLILRYLSLLWAGLTQPAAGNRPHTPSLPTHTSAMQSRTALSISLAPRNSYATSMDSIIFRWRQVSWARKYFLRMRTPQGQLCLDSVLVDTQAVVHFPGRMLPGNGYTWSLDIVGESGRLQFADSGHIVLVNESAILPGLPPIEADSIGGIGIILQQVEQFENATCIKQAEKVFQRLTTDFPQDAALNELYFEFRQRNYY
ncbi:MAG TPA: hypothetical protein VFE32_04115 [Puia sp.]|jgi:hypothetical protein|nr:hypothetical protein [Puia sp.]